MAEQKPTIGRVVHYYSYGTPGGEYLPEPRAAIITALEKVNTAPLYLDRNLEVVSVDLCVLNPTGMFFNQGVLYSDEPKPGHWSWPPRV